MSPNTNHELFALRRVREVNSSIKTLTTYLFVLLLRIGWRSRPYTDRYFQSTVMSAFQMGSFLPKVTISLFARCGNVTMIKKNCPEEGKGLPIPFQCAHIFADMSTEHLLYSHFSLYLLTIRAAMTKITFPIEGNNRITVQFSCSDKHIMT